MSLHQQKRNLLRKIYAHTDTAYNGSKLSHSKAKTVTANKPAIRQSSGMSQQKSGGCNSCRRQKKHG